jgi:hypothetical protein
MAPAKPAGEELQLFCHDTREYVYLGPLQDWLTFRYPKNPFPALQGLAQQGRVFQKFKKRSGINYDKTKFACDYLRLHCYSGKIIPRVTCHATQSFLETIFHGATDADDATKFINNHNLTMLVTRRTYSNPSTYTDDVVALLSWTDRNKPVVYIGWAAVSGGQLSAPGYLPSPLANSQSAEYGFPDESGLPKPLPKEFTRLGLMTVMFELMELGTCGYRKIKSTYIYLHVNPNESATNTSPHLFWTKRGFDPVNATLVVTPLTATEDATALAQAEVKTLEQAEVLAGVKELRAHFEIHPQDGKQTDNDKGMVIYSRRHKNECTFIHTLTDEARDTILAEAARKAQEAQAVKDKPPEVGAKPPNNDDDKPSADDETESKAAAKKPPEGKPPGDDETEKVEAETKRKAAEIRKREAARSVAKEQYIKAHEDLYEAQTALATAQVACTKTSKAVEVVQKRIMAAEKAKTKADKVHATSFLQLDVLGQAVEAANSLVTEAEKRKASGQELETLTMKASIAENDKMNFTTQVKQDARTKKGAATGLTKRQGDVVPLLAVAATADKAMESAAS